MSQFTSLLTVSPLADGRSWWLRTPFEYDEGPGDSIEVPVGFVTDFASVPRILWSILPQWGRYGNAAVVHDYLYWKQPVSRPEADHIFLDGMKVLRVSVICRSVMFGAVRAFGWWSWLSNRWDRRAGIDRVVSSGLEKVGDKPPARPGLIRHVIEGRPWRAQ